MLLPLKRILVQSSFRIILAILVLASVCVAQSNDDDRINPTPDPNAPFKVYIPQDLDDCFVEQCQDRYD
jgi:hypothetical protein